MYEGKFAFLQATRGIHSYEKQELICFSWCDLKIPEGNDADLEN